jgi:hypothetical protein
MRYKGNTSYANGAYAAYTWDDLNVIGNQPDATPTNLAGLTTVPQNTYAHWGGNTSAPLLPEDTHCP